jgi:cyclopropane fatty-acyl-phospholipid synthase-like methyltransferase
VCRDGVIEFAAVDEFYEREGFVSTGRDFGSSPLQRLQLWFARHHYLHDITLAIPAGASVLEIGCGGGSAFLGRRYDMLGVDLSRSSTQSAATAYSSVIRASCVELPVTDSSVDAVVSSFILEHLEGVMFEKFFQEMARIIRPGGHMVHYFDLENDAPFTRWAKKQPWYHRLFVTERGHCSLRHASEWAGQFERHGFRTERQRFSCKTWAQDISIWSRLDDPEVRKVPRLTARAVRRFSHLIGRPSDVVVCVYQDCIERFYPDSWASKVIWVLQKSNRERLIR